MRNVVKGFQVSKMGMPNVSTPAMNKAYNDYHAPKIARQIRMYNSRPISAIPRPGKNPGIKGGMGTI